jgi:hypothetical protein
VGGQAEIACWTEKEEVRARGSVSGGGSIYQDEYTRRSHIWPGEKATRGV